jgi:hypothetical protein
MPVKRDDQWSERDSQYSGKLVVMIRLLLIDPRQGEISNGFVKPKISK